jgi:hypothetical protein
VKLDGRAEGAELGDGVDRVSSKGVPVSDDAAHASEVVGAGTVGSSPAASGRAVSAVSYPGVGTEAALSAPDCDRKTGRMKLPIVYAPPCVAVWKPGLNNGGPTATGVTSTEIKIVWAFGSCETADQQAVAKAFDADCRTFDDQKAMLEREITMWSRHLEFYGRKIVPVFFRTRTNGDDEAGARSDALTIAQMKPFMVMPPSVSFIPLELAKRGVLVSTAATYPQEVHDGVAPYLWTTAPASNDINAAVFGDWIGSRIAKQPAKWAGDATLRTKQRAFGLVYPDVPEFTPVVRVLEARLAKYGVTLKSKVAMSTDPAQAPEASRLVIAKFKEEGVNAVIPFVNLIFAMVPLTKEATNQQFFPEWVTTDVGYILTYPYFTRTYDAAQRGQFYGITAKIVDVPSDQRPCPRMIQWEYGPQTPVYQLCNGAPFPVNAFPFYGIHLAGPKLTVQSFTKALFSLPPAGGAATGGITTSQVSWGNWPFTLGFTDYTARDDYAEAYFDPNAVDQYGRPGPGSFAENGTAPGVLRFLNGGRRFVGGNSGSGLPKMFDAAATVISLPDAPSSEKFDYENKKNCVNRWTCFGG